MTILAQVIADYSGDRNTQSNSSMKSSDLVIRVRLVANTVHTITIPTVSSAITSSAGNARRFIAFFSWNVNTNLFIQPDTTTVLAFPTTTAAVSTSELNPWGGREVAAGQSIQLLSAGTDVDVTVRLYSLNY